MSEEKEKTPMNSEISDNSDLSQVEEESGEDKERLLFLSIDALQILRRNLEKEINADIRSRNKSNNDENKEDNSSSSSYSSHSSDYDDVIRDLAVSSDSLDEDTLKPNTPVEISVSGLRRTHGNQVVAGFAAQTRTVPPRKQDPLAVAVQEILPRAEVEVAAGSQPQFPTKHLFVPVDPFNIVVTYPVSEGGPAQVHCWEKLKPGDTGLLRDVNIDYAAKALISSGLISCDGIPAPSPETLRLIENSNCSNVDQFDQDDRRDAGFLFTQGFNKRVKRVQVIDLGPSVHNLIRADRILGRDVYSQQENLHEKYFPVWMKSVDPVTVFRRLFLDDDTKRKLTINSNAALRKIDCSKTPVLRECGGISFQDMEKYILAVCLTRGCYPSPGSKNPTMDRYYHSILMPVDRMIQISHVVRLKNFGQTSDEYVEWLNFFINTRLAMLHRRLPRVLTVHSYSICESLRTRPQYGKLSTRRLYVTVIRAGYVLFRMQFHHLPSDSQISGFHVSAGVTVLQRLFNNIKLKGRYVVMPGECTLEAAEFFHTRGARFIGSTGTQPASLTNLEHATTQAGIILPQPPRFTFHFEPIPGLREILLMRYYMIGTAKCPLQRGYLKMALGVVTEPHIFCNIGGSSFVPLQMNHVDPRCPQAMIPLHCFLMMRHKQLNRSYEQFCHSEERFGYCCYSWHQKLMMHALFSGFLSCWMSHSAANNQLVSHRRASQIILEKMLDAMKQRIDQRRRFFVYRRLRAELRVMRGALNARIKHLDEEKTESEKPASRRPRPQVTAMAKQCRSAVINPAGHMASQASEGRVQTSKVKMSKYLPSQLNNVTIMTRSAATHGLHNVNAMEERLQEVGRGPDGDWLRNGVPLPDNAFDDLGLVDEDSSDHDSDYSSKCN